MMLRNTVGPQWENIQRRTKPSCISIRRQQTTIDMESFLSLTCIIYTVLLTATLSEATCNLDQQYSCKRAVREERLDVLPGGGECFEKEYVQFSYLCVVNNYLPSVDYCCCAFHSSIFCCRYHQDWNQFRCLHEEDEVTSRSLNETDGQLGGGTDPMARLMQLSLPSALLLLILLLFGLGVIGCCLVTSGVSCCSRRFRKRIKDKKRNCVQKKSQNKFKDSRFLQRTPIRDLDSLSGLMHGLTGGISSPDHLTPVPVIYEDDPVTTDGVDGLHGPGGHRILLQPSAPSLSEILGLQEEYGMGCSQLLGHPFALPTTGSDESGFWWSRRQDCMDPSAAGGSTGDPRDPCFSGSPIRCQLCTEPCSSPHRPSGVGRCQRCQVVSAFSRH